MKDKYDGCYIDNYKDHYAVFADNGEKLAEYDNHKEAKEDIAEWEAEVKNESYIPADTLATGYRFTIRETELLENAIKKHVEQKVDQGVNSMFDTDSEEFKKVGNEPYDKSQWWDDMKLTMRIKKTPFPRKNGYTNGDFRPNQKWLMGAIDCCKSARDCDYLLKDAYLSVAHDKKLIQNLKSVQDGNPNKYVNVKVVQKWLDNGVTPEKVEKHIEWFKANYIKGLQAKKKEFNKTQNEAVTEDPMNEGTAGNIALGIFCLIGMAPVIAAKVMEAKDKRRLKTGKGAHKISYEEFSTMYNSTKKLIQDIQRLQKSSKYYKIIYKYNEVKEQIIAGNKSSNILDAFKKGTPVELYGICDYFAYDCIEKYKDLLKSLPEPDKDYYSGKNEDYIYDIENAIQDEFNDHLDKLGFADGKDYKCRSSKYPGIYISYTESGDGTWFHIYPDCPGTIVVIDNNKLNENHSEISNDPEIEELMALAGVTTADLDDLENDNDLGLDEDDPIDANTLREIDAAMDESVGGVIAISVAGLIGGAAIVNAITKRKLKAEAKEMTKAEFDKLINDMLAIDEVVISKLKTSKWWKFIYEPCMNRKNTSDIHSQASEYKQEFIAGKYIGPSFHSSFVDIDDPDPKIYTKLDAEIGRSPDDEAWEKAFDSAYYESQKLIKEAVKKLGFNDEGKSSKYPDIKIHISSGEYIGIWIEPIYNGYYKLKDSKKSQNESVETNLDILLAESTEFLIEE